ncbi:MAG: lipase/acyltransferase domain-containing protein, partial [Acidimicrobiia bacterium]
MSEKERMPDVIVVIPGILGSVLSRGGEDVWAISGGAIVQALLSLGGSIKDLELKEDPLEKDDVDGVVASRLISDVHLLPGFWKIDGYTELIETIKRDFQVEMGRNLVTFPYDWRRDIRVAARQLQRDSHKWLQAWQDHSGNADAKLILVAHSLGGLVSRYFLECMEGWRVTRRLVTFGTPYRGSLNALDSLANGVHHKLGPIEVLNLTPLVRSMTSSYQLLPTFRCYDPGNGGQLVKVADATIEGVDQARAAAALAVHNQVAAAVEANQQNDDYLQARYRLNLVVGEIQPTNQSARWNGEKVELLRTHEGEDHGGDGTVPRMSATPIDLEGQEREMWFSERHSRLQNFDPVLTHLHGVFTADQID